MTDEKNCMTCEYYGVSEEYWHDHYLIPQHHLCFYQLPYTPKDIDPHGCCEHYKRKEDSKSER